ncbi:uncharacterized protein LOC127263527 [Andrographis paniculata]|uniref:uncharacterized protein LOC127263527 n=1 Tax=Andrographis paniculata TaxID=175694 RepID=UPI0021E788B0|nr:uncharacterized protein LOC127263527 [Andrographis paniculata]
MKDCFPARLKRKDLEDVSDDFSDFSLSSPARKIRRLDAEQLPPIIEEEECEIPIEIEEPLPDEQSYVSNYSCGIRIEELPNEPSNEERAIVLFKPMSANPLVQSPSNFSVSPNLILGFKNQMMLSSKSDGWKPTGGDEEENDSSGADNGCRAVVPWVAPQHRPTPGAEELLPQQVDSSEMMDTQEVAGETAMDVEDSPGLDQGNVNGGTGAGLEQQFHQWQKQHCLIPSPPQNSTTPITWYR